MKTFLLLSLSIITFKNDHLDTLNLQLKTAQKIFQQCEIDVSSDVEIQVLEPNEPLIFYASLPRFTDDKRNNHWLSLMRSIDPKRIPILVLDRSNIRRDELPPAAMYFTQKTAPLHGIVLAQESLSQSDTLAHELGHVLFMDEYHVDNDPENLMYDSFYESYRGDKITPAQCAKARFFMKIKD